MKLLPDVVVKRISKMIVDILLRKYATIEVKGLENVENAITPTLFICNHLSNSDGLILNHVLKQYSPTFVAGVKLSCNDVTNIGMNVVKTTTIEPNSADREGLKRIIGLIKNGENLLIFPEGTRSRTGSMIEAKKGTILIAKISGVPIVPIGLYGSEMLLPINLEGDMDKEKFQKAVVHVNIGNQFVLPELEKDQNKKAYDEHTLRYIMSKIAELVPDEYRGVYK